MKSSNPSAAIDFTDIVVEGVFFKRCWDFPCAQHLMAELDAKGAVYSAWIGIPHEDGNSYYLKRIKSRIPRS